jgi:hypothetical protein
MGLGLVHHRQCGHPGTHNGYDDNGDHRGGDHDGNDICNYGANYPSNPGTDHRSNHGTDHRSNHGANDGGIHGTSHDSNHHPGDHHPGDHHPHDHNDAIGKEHFFFFTILPNFQLRACPVNIWGSLLSNGEGTRYR